jgi:hypothetical protein
MVLAALVAGCLAHTVTYRRGSVEARGTREPLRAPSFYFVRIGVPAHPWDGRRPAFVLELPGGRRIASGGLTAEVVRSLAGRRVLSETFRVNQGWPEGVEEVDLEPFYFVLLGDRVLSVELGLFQYPEGPASVYTARTLESATAPAIGDAKAAVLYRFPLSLEQVTGLFGEPEALVEGLLK